MFSSVAHFFIDSLILGEFSFWALCIFWLSVLCLMILLIWVLSVLILVRLARGLSILFIFSNNQLFVLLILCVVFLVSINFGPYFYYFSPSACFRFCLLLLFEEFEM
jgi:hypothetical protein